MPDNGAQGLEQGLARVRAIGANGPAQAPRALDQIDVSYYITNFGTADPTPLCDAISEASRAEIWAFKTKAYDDELRARRNGTASRQLCFRDGVQIDKYRILLAMADWELLKRSRFRKRFHDWAFPLRRRWAAIWSGVNLIQSDNFGVQVQRREHDPFRRFYSLGLRRFARRFIARPVLRYLVDHHRWILGSVILIVAAMISSRQIRLW